MRWRSSSAGLILTLALASCEGPRPTVRGAARDLNPVPDDTAAADESGTEAGGKGTSRAKKDICTTLDYGHDRSNADYFLQFADDAAAMEYSKGFLAANDITDPTEMTRDARTIRLVGRVFDGFRKVFPHETSGMTRPPRIIAVKADGINAFAGYDERKEYEKAPWIFWVHQPTIDSNKPDAELEALYAHELAHLILRNMLPETRTKIRTHYRVPGGGEKGVIGAAAPDDEVVRPRAQELRTIGSLVGREPAFGSIPMSAYEDSEYQSLLKTLAKARPNSQACQLADTSVARTKQFYRDHVSVHDLTLDLTPAQVEDLGALTKAADDALRSCYAGVKKSILELKIDDKSVRVLVDGEPAPRERLLDPSTEEHKLVYGALMTNDVERDVDGRTNLPTIDRLLEVTSTLHRRAGELSADHSFPIDDLRVFDLEEDADDTAVRVLRAIGDDPRGAASLFMAQLDDPSTCSRRIAQGEIPRYGRFIDPHNATCWRAWHSLDLVDALDRCPSSPPSASSGDASDQRSFAGAASSTPPRMRLVQRSRLRVR